MTRVSPYYWLLLGLTLLLYLIMVFWSLPILQTASGGLSPFDLRLGGYSETDARLFLNNLSQDGRDFYLNTQQKLDLAFPALLALSLGLALYGLFRAPRLRIAFVPLPFIASGFDYLENSRVAVMLKTPVDLLSAEQIAAASQATILKFIFIALAFIAALVGLGFYRRRQRQDKI